MSSKKRRTIKIKNLRPGDPVTVCRLTDESDGSFIGDVLRVMTVNYPFVVVEKTWKNFPFVEEGEEEKENFSINCNDFEFVRLSKKYVELNPSGY